MKISIVVACSLNWVIGCEGKIPWNLPDDLKHFRDLTMVHQVIMGRKTWENIPQKHRPLGRRENIVLSRFSDFEAPGGIVSHSLEEALQIAQKAGEEEAMIIGGGQVYQLALPLANKIYLTMVNVHMDGDAYFPRIGNGWKLTSHRDHGTDERHQSSFQFQVYERTSANSLL